MHSVKYNISFDEPLIVVSTFFHLVCSGPQTCDGSSSETQGESVGSGERARRKFSSRAKEPLDTDSHRAISKNSSGCRLLIGHKKCFVLLCLIGEQFLLSSFREFVHDGYCFDHGLFVFFAPKKCTQSGNSV